MSTFDAPNYFAKRSAATQAKIDAIEASRQQKVADLDRAGQNYRAEQAAYENSWVGKLGLEPEGIAANAVNLGASFVSGAAREAGNIASLPSSMSSVMERMDVTDGELEAYNRYVSGKPKLGDSTLLNRSLNGQTVFTKLQNSIALGQDARATAKAFAVNEIVEPTNRKALVDSLSAAYRQ